MGGGCGWRRRRGRVGAELTPRRVKSAYARRFICVSVNSDSASHSRASLVWCLVPCGCNVDYLLRKR